MKGLRVRVPVIASFMSDSARESPAVTPLLNSFC